MTPYPETTHRYGPRRVLLALAMLIAVVWASPAQAATTKAMWGPSSDAAFARYQELGVGVYQMQLSWRAAAPTRPLNPTETSAYNWPPGIDQAIARASGRGIKVALLVRQTPTWATSPQGGPHYAAPAQVQDFANFMTAARKRYPQVNRWMIWGETNRVAVWNGGAVKYAQLLDAAYGALKATGLPSTVVGGMTFTYGETPPAQWINGMKLGGGRPRMDEYGHNPFSRRCPDLRQGPNYLRQGARDISDVDTMKGEVAAAFGSAKPLWLSEFTVSSDRATRAFTFFVSRATQADWLTRAYRIAGGAGGVSGLGWFDLYDENAPNGLTNGLLDVNLNPKPAFNAFKGTTTNEGLPGACPVAARPAAPAPDRLGPRVSLTAASKVRLRTLLKKGYTFKFRCNESCRASATLLIDKKTARQTGLKRRARSAVAVGKASKGLAPAGSRTMKIKLARKAKSKLKRVRRGKLTLRLTVTDAARNATKKTKNIRLTR